MLKKWLVEKSVVDRHLVKKKKKKKERLNGLKLRKRVMLRAESLKIGALYAYGLRPKNDDECGRKRTIICRRVERGKVYIVKAHNCGGGESLLTM